MGSKLTILEDRAEAQASAAGGAAALIARLVSRLADGSWLVKVGAEQRRAHMDPSVDPVLLEGALKAGSAVVLEQGERLTILGAIATQPALVMDREGNVKAEVRSLDVRAEEEVVLKVAGAFVRAKNRTVEIYGEKVVTRAQNVAKILAAMIKLN